MTFCGKYDKIILETEKPRFYHYRRARRTDLGEHDGHRMRLIAKLKEDNLEEHEMLEVLLFNAIPRRNTNDLAHRLLAEFGSIKAMFEASIEQLQAVNGIGASVAAYLFVIGSFYKRNYKTVEIEYPEFFERDVFFPYVKSKYASMHREVLDFYFLAPDSKITGHKLFGNESFFNAEVAVEELAKLIVERAPAGVTVVHNHPLGKAEPSATDDQMTKQIQMLCSMHNVILCDHIIYAPNGVYSYYLDGKLKKISEEYSMSGIIFDKETKKADGRKEAKL